MGRSRLASISVVLLLAGCGQSAAPSSTPSIAPGTTTAASPAVATATPAPTPNAVTEHIDVAGLTRDYIVVTPSDIATREQMPLLLVLHGAGQTMRDAQSYGFDLAAGESGAVVVYPQGKKDPLFPNRPGYAWNAGASDTGVDDVALIKALIQRLTAKYAIDSKVIFVVGASNGGQMAYRAACELSDRIAAVGDISGALLVDCQPSSRVSVIDIHGMADTMIPPSGGGEGCLPKQCPPLHDTQDAWRQIDGCSGDPSITTIAPESVETEWAACDDATAVAFIRAGNTNHFLQGIQFDPAEVVWAFLKAHPRSTGPS